MLVTGCVVLVALTPDEQHLAYRAILGMSKQRGYMKIVRYAYKLFLGLMSIADCSLQVWMF